MSVWYPFFAKNYGLKFVLISETPQFFVIQIIEMFQFSKFKEHHTITVVYTIHIENTWQVDYESSNFSS